MAFVKASSKKIKYIPQIQTDVSPSHENSVRLKIHPESDTCIVFRL